ncbi:MAG TPA: hypothetical protein PLU30_18725 [Verrucomicrobiae bacterium]|nr:hypothetical protein [Verrucomicrobiae bacterium]
MKRKDFDRLAARRFFKRALRQGTWPLLQRLIVYPSVLKLPPIRFAGNTTHAVHTVVRERDAAMAHWMLRTLHQCAPAPLSVALHLDPTVRPGTAAKLAEKFPDARVISYAEARARVAPAIAGFPRLRRWVDSSPWAIKAVDTYLLGESRWLISVDCDVLFFGPPTSLFGDTPSAVWMEDGNYALDLPPEAGLDLLGLRPLMPINTGVGRIERRLFDPATAERVLERVPEPVNDQVVHAAITARAADATLLPTREYNYVKEPGLEDRIARHYTTPSRFLFVEEGVPRAARLIGMRLPPLLRERP